MCGHFSNPKLSKENPNKKIKAVLFKRPNFSRFDKHKQENKNLDMLSYKFSYYASTQMKMLHKLH